MRHYEGFPYVVTRIGHTALRHISLLPADWSRERLVSVARRQARANMLETCLCLGLSDGVYFHLDGTETTGSLFVAGVPVVGKLRLPVQPGRSPELLAREASLRAFVESFRLDGFLVGDGLEGGRTASPDDVARLAGRGAGGVPRGLAICDTCGFGRGEYLALAGEGNGNPTPRVVDVHCRCQNHNRCARCGGPLAAGRLSAYEWDPAARRVLYLAAYAGLGHRCRDGTRASRPAGVV